MDIVACLTNPVAHGTPTPTDAPSSMGVERPQLFPGGHGHVIPPEHLDEFALGGSGYVPSPRLSPPPSLGERGFVPRPRLVDMLVAPGPIVAAP